jgi:hypothetical protein
MITERPGRQPGASGTLQNMSCRPRTTVRSGGLAPSSLSPRLQGKRVLVSLEGHIPECMKTYAKRHPQMGVPLLNALLTLGGGHPPETYKKFIKGHKGHEEGLMNRLKPVPREVARLGRVGHIRPMSPGETRSGAVPVAELRAALFMMARSNRSVYIRDKTLLLSLVSVSRSIQVTFVEQGG